MNDLDRFWADFRVKIDRLLAETKEAEEAADELMLDMTAATMRLEAGLAGLDDVIAGSPTEVATEYALRLLRETLARDGAL